jgi:hypothetical protein
MNGLYLFLTVFGGIAVSVACMKFLKCPLNPLTHLGEVLLSVMFVAGVFCALDALAARHHIVAGQAVLTAMLGVIFLLRAFCPEMLISVIERDPPGWFSSRHHPAM